MVTDITENLLKTDNVRMLSAAIEKSGSSVIITDETGTVEYSNTRFRDITGYEDGLIGENINRISSHEYSKEYYQNLWETISTGGTWSGNFHNRKKDGNYYWCTSVIVPARSTVTGQLKYICIQEDITQTRQREAALSDIKRAMEQQEVLSSIGAMLSGIIHEINSPLAIINGNMQFLMDFITKSQITDENAREAAEDIQSGLDHLKHLLIAYKELVQGEIAPPKGSFDLRKEIATILEVTRNEYKYDIFVDFKPGESIMLYGSSGHMRQVVMNLLINAIYSVKRRDHQKPGIISLSAVRNGACMRFEIHDNGQGVPPDVINRIFETLYTTKPAGEGTGLGLSICKNIIEEHFSGTLGVESNPGDTMFYFEIPLPEEQ